MITSTANTRPFSFDTEFDDAGGVTPGQAFRPTKRAYLPAEVEALVAQARLEGRETALAEVESLRASVDEIEASGRGWSFAKLTIAHGAIRSFARAL